MREVLELPFFFSPLCLNSDLHLPLFHSSLLHKTQVQIVDLTVDL